MAENDELKKFKSDEEANRKQFEVDKTLQEMSEKVDVPDTAMAEMKEKAKEFDLMGIDGWKNYCKAKAFDFAAKVKPGKTEDEIKRYGLPFTFTAPVKKSDDLIWTAK